MEAIFTLLSAIWEFIKLLAYMAWEFITLIPKTIGLPEWAVITVGIILILIAVIPCFKRHFR